METVVRDDPSLTVRRVETHRQPLRVVLDPNQRTPSEAVLLNDGFETLVMGQGFSSLPRMLDQLGDREIQRLMVEGGPTTIASFLDQQLVDEFYLIRSDVTHQSPIPSNIDSQRLTSAGLFLTSTETWGEEVVELWAKPQES